MELHMNIIFFCKAAAVKSLKFVRNHSWLSASYEVLYNAVGSNITERSTAPDDITYTQPNIDHSILHMWG